MYSVDTDRDVSFSFDGRLLRPGDGDYEYFRVERVWQSRKPSRYPAAILVARSERDLVNAVRYARAHGLKLGVRAGGHSFPAWGVRDAALLVDLVEFKQIDYDPQTEIASVTPAVMGGFELNPYLRQFGRFFPGGGCPSVGIGGFLLQGGQGWNFRGWGYAAEQIVAIDVVTAEGDLVRADEHQNADLFWAARGSGPGFFGLIARFHLRTRPICAGLAVTLQVFDLQDYPQVLDWLWDAHADLSDAVALYAMSLRPPELVPGSSSPFVFAIQGIAFCDTLDESREALSPLDSNPFLDRALMVEHCEPTTLEKQYEYVDLYHPHGHRYRVDSAWVKGDRAAIIAASHKLVTERPAAEPGHTFFSFKLARDAPDMAMDLETDMMVGAYVIYSQEEDDERYRQWSLEAMAPLNPFTVGQYWGDSDQAHRSVKCLTDKNWARLMQIRSQRDPDRLFVGYLAETDDWDNSHHWERGAG